MSAVVRDLKYKWKVPYQVFIRRHFSQYLTSIVRVLSPRSNYECWCHPVCAQSKLIFRWWSRKQNERVFPSRTCEIKTSRSHQASAFAAARRKRNRLGRPVTGVRRVRTIHRWPWNGNRKHKQKWKSERQTEKTKHVDSNRMSQQRSVIHVMPLGKWISKGRETGHQRSEGKGDAESSGYDKLPIPNNMAKKNW